MKLPYEIPNQIDQYAQMAGCDNPVTEKGVNCLRLVAELTLDCANRGVARMNVLDAFPKKRLGWYAEVNSDLGISAYDACMNLVASLYDNWRLDESGAPIIVTEERTMLTLEDGTIITVVLTHEGVIVDHFSYNGDELATFGQTYDEMGLL